VTARRHSRFLSLHEKRALLSHINTV